MAGGQAVAIHHESTPAAIKLLHRSLNGVILPGGNSGPMYKDALTLLVNLTLDAAHGPPGDRVPLWGICLGFEMLVQAVAQNASVRTSPWDSLLLPLPLNVSASSRMFRGMPPALRSRMGRANVTMHNHGAGASPAVFGADGAGNARLHATFDVTSTATDRQGRVFANVIEGKDGLPLFGTIWHPEMPPFEHEIGVIPHSRAAVQVSQWAADFFLQLCRDSNRRFPTAEAEAEALITGDAGLLTDCRGEGSQISECYYWKKKSRPEIQIRHAAAAAAAIRGD